MFFSILLIILCAFSFSFKARATCIIFFFADSILAPSEIKCVVIPYEGSTLKNFLGFDLSLANTIVGFKDNIPSFGNCNQYPILGISFTISFG